MMKENFAVILNKLIWFSFLLIFPGYDKHQPIDIWCNNGR